MLMCGSSDIISIPRLKSRRFMIKISSSRHGLPNVNTGTSVVVQSIGRVPSREVAGSLLTWLTGNNFKTSCHVIMSCQPCQPASASAASNKLHKSRYPFLFLLPFYQLCVWQLAKQEWALETTRVNWWRSGLPTCFTTPLLRTIVGVSTVTSHCTSDVSPRRVAESSNTRYVINGVPIGAAIPDRDL